MTTTQTDIDRIPPHNLQAEMALIGAALCDREIAAEFAPTVRPEWFYAHVHERIWNVIRQLVQADAPVDKITLAEKIGRENLEKVGGISYLSTMMDTVQTVSSARYYATIVREKAQMRTLVSIGSTIAELGYSEHDIAMAIGRVNDLVRSVVDSAAPRRALTMAEALANYDEAMATTGGLSYLTPWPKLDKATGGFTADELVVWASDEGVGKSIILAMLTAYVAETYCFDEQGQPIGQVAYFATEMGANKSTARFIALYSQISARRQRQGMHAALNESSPFKPFSRAEEVAINVARNRLFSLPIAMFDETLAVDELIGQVRKLHRDLPVKMVVVDTLGALEDLNGIDGDASTHQRQKRVVWLLKRLAKEIQAPVHVAHHLNRKDRDGGRPTKKNLMDGGMLGQTATTVIFPHREEGDVDEIDPRTQQKRPGSQTKRVRRYMLIIDKARDGSDGVVIPMEFEGAKARWLEKDQKTIWLDPEPEQQALLPGDDDTALFV